MFGIDVQEDTGQFPQRSGFEEVGGAAGQGYASAHGDAEGVEHFL
jgi:hypothetical protein